MCWRIQHSECNKCKVNEDVCFVSVYYIVNINDIFQSNYNINISYNNTSDKKYNGFLTLAKNILGRNFTDRIS